MRHGKIRNSVPITRRIDFLLLILIVIASLASGCRKHSDRDDDIVWKSPVPPDSPRCSVKVMPPYGTNDSSVAFNAVKEFAAAHSLAEVAGVNFNLRKGEFYSGPRRLIFLFKNDRYAMWSSDLRGRGPFYLAPLNPTNSLEGFQRLTNSFILEFQRAFPDRVEVISKQSATN
jgi:hypothetical protein